MPRKLEQQAEIQWYTSIGKVLPLILRKLCFLSDSAKLLCWYYSSPTVSLKWHVVILTALVKFLNSRNEKEMIALVWKPYLSWRECLKLGTTQSIIYKIHSRCYGGSRWGELNSHFSVNLRLGSMKLAMHMKDNHKWDTSFKDVRYVQSFYKIELQQTWLSRQ